MTLSRSDDTLTPWGFEHARVRGALGTQDAASRAILARHPYPPARALFDPTEPASTMRH